MEGSPRDFAGSPYRCCPAGRTPDARRFTEHYVDSRPTCSDFEQPCLGRAQKSHWSLQDGGTRCMDDGRSLRLPQGRCSGLQGSTGPGALAIGSDRDRQGELDPVLRSVAGATSSLCRPGSACFAGPSKRRLPFLKTPGLKVGRNLYGSPAGHRHLPDQAQELGESLSRSERRCGAAKAKPKGKAGEAMPMQKTLLLPPLFLGRKHLQFLLQVC